MTTSNNPDEIRAEIERTRYELGQDVDALAEKVSPTKAVSRQTERVKHGVKDGLQSVKENIMGTPDHHTSPSATDRARYAAADARSTAHDVADQARGTAHDVADQARDWADDAQHAVRQAPAQVRGRTAGNPLAAGLIAFGAGMLVSALIPASEVEQRAAERVKDQAAPLVDQAKHVAQEMGEDLKPLAQDAAQSVKDAAADAADHVKAEGADKAQGLKAESADAAQQVKGTAKNA
ncbi:DUF3618 domain-containing protein [Micrococcus sp. EYE_162]|uniref:DUF3618 domain-containing protein n=1 Tax=Micrococcus TaxID=1269 RepID=UPI002003CE7E|nr:MULTISPECIES: DUF3618 domain-containing protein [unclassified Micrococcus]MCK6096489.1 DUF3618 domain-containing protein [Micrococcus sp. EYE_212]MCK6172663.1 DUF3618 domain-containing protein [Micrococcus sp. EYE_162]